VALLIWFELVIPMYSLYYCVFSIKHLLSNLILQLLIGIPLEMVHKFWRVGIVYTLGVIAGQYESILSTRSVLLQFADDSVNTEYVLCVFGSILILYH